MVEYKLPKLGVASSILVTRFNIMKKIFIFIAVILTLTSCVKKEVAQTSKQVDADVIDNVSFVTRNDFALYLYDNLNWRNNNNTDNNFLNLNRAKQFVITHHYMYTFPDNEFKGDRLLTWIDFVMFFGAFYNKLYTNEKASLPNLKEYSYLRSLFEVLLSRGLLKYDEIANFKGNFPVPEAIVKDRIGKLKMLIDEN